MALSILEAVGRLAAMAAAQEAARHSALERAATIVETEAKALIGTYDAGWLQLADDTQAARTKAGYPANEPLLVEGELRASIGHAVEGRKAVVGSTSEVAVWQEQGTDHVPARSFLGSAAHRKAEEVARVMGREMVSKVFTRP